MYLRRYFPVFCLLFLVILVQVGLAALKLEFYMTQLTMSAYYTLVALGLCLLMGYAGQVSMGHGGFFAIGGYAAAVLATVGFASWVSLPAAILITGLVALLIGIPVLRLRGHYLAMATLAFGIHRAPHPPRHKPLRRGGRSFRHPGLPPVCRPGDHRQEGPARAELLHRVGPGPRRPP